MKKIQMCLMQLDHFTKARRNGTVTPTLETTRLIVSSKHITLPVGGKPVRHSLFSSQFRNTGCIGSVAPWLCLSMSAMPHACYAPDRTGKSERRSEKSCGNCDVLTYIHSYCHECHFCRLHLAQFTILWKCGIPQFYVSRMACGISCFDGTSRSLWSNGSLEYETKFNCMAWDWYLWLCRL